MNSEERSNRALEVVVVEKVLTQLKTQMLVVYGVSFALAAIVASSLTWQYKTLSDLASTRISEYQLLVADGLSELHRLDLDEVSARTRARGRCETSLPKEEAEVLLTKELGRLPEGAELRLLLERAEDFGVCDAGEVQHLFEDVETMAKVDTVYRLLLGRPADPIGRFIYGYWIASGMDIEAVARDVMTSPEFARLKKLSVES